ncbi:LPXTG cell wall anchor domain-containing protein [Gardnerella swidsinskii]
MLPKTGESTSFAGLLASIGFSIAGLAILLKKKMMEENK